MLEPIVIENLSRYYNKFLAVDNLCLRVAENENVGLLGPNGAGKSTTLKIICNLIRASSGAVYIDGISVAKKPEQALARIGAIVETPEFYSFLTPEEILSYLGRLRGMRRDELGRRMREVIQLVRLEKWFTVTGHTIIPVVERLNFPVNPITLMCEFADDNDHLRRLFK